MSAIPLIATELRTALVVRFVPETDVRGCLIWRCKCEPGHISLAADRAIHRWRCVWVCNMESKFDIVTIIHVVFVAAYVAIALDHVAQYDLGYSLQEIRGAAVMTAVVIAAFIAIDFFGKKLGKAK